jgi:hypothetical protein
MRLKWKLVSDYLEIVLMLTHCDEHTMGSKIILEHPMEPLGGVGHVISCFGQFGDSVSVSAR